MREAHSDNQIFRDTRDVDKQEGDMFPTLGEANVHMRTKTGHYK